MKAFGSILTIMLAGLGAARGQVLRDAVRPNPVRISTRVQMRASVEQLSVRIGDPVMLRFHFKNVTSSVLHLASSGWDLDYGLTVTDPSGVEIPRTAQGEGWLRSQRNGIAVSSMSFSLEAGAEADEIVMNVAKYYQLSKPGKYFVRVMRRGYMPPDPDAPKPTAMTAEEAQRIPIEESVSDLIPFTITP
jgi:hypothetical protein